MVRIRDRSQTLEEKLHNSILTEIFSVNWPSMYLLMKVVLPTPASPRITTLTSLYKEKIK